MLSFRTLARTGRGKDNIILLPMWFQAMFQEVLVATREPTEDNIILVPIWFWVKLQEVLVAMCEPTEDNIILLTMWFLGGQLYQHAGKNRRRIILFLYQCGSCTDLVPGRITILYSYRLKLFDYNENSYNLSGYILYCT